MANQTLQLAKLLRAEDAIVELIQVNRPYCFRWIAKVRGVRAAFRLLPYLAHLWRSAGEVQVFHVMANSGWSWHLFAAPAIWIASVRGTPVIVNYRGGEADVFFNKWFAWVRPSLDRVDAIIVPSGFLETVFEKRGFTPSIVPNIIDLSRFRPETGFGSSSPEKSPHILVTRNLELIYDNATALRAFNIVKRTFPGANLTIAGVGPERQALEELAIRLGLETSITFTGHIDNESIAALYRIADVMVNPSLADNMPISILEALASGVPIVSTDVGGVPYMVEHGKTALLVPVQDPEAMARAILALLSDPAKAKQMRKAGIESLQQYTWPNVRDRLLRVYEQVLTKSDRSPVSIK